MATQDPSRYLPIGTRVKLSAFGRKIYGYGREELITGTGTVTKHRQQENYNEVTTDKGASWFNREHLTLTNEKWKKNYENLI